jgi:flagellar motor switch protein FliM
MATIISQDELDTLLASIQVADRRRKPHSAGATAALYDFRYAAKLSPDHMRILQGRIVSLASVLNRTMSVYLNNVAEFAVHSIDVASYEQYIRNLAVDPVLGVITFGPSAPPALWEMSPGIAAVALDCMLGGTGSSQQESISGEATPLEGAILRRFYEEILSAWTELWDRLKALKPRVQGVVSSASAVDLRAVDERLFCVVLAVTLARTKGMLRLGVPLSVVKRLLREEKEMVTALELGQVGEQPVTTGVLADTPMVVSAFIEPPEMPLATLMRMQPGEVLDLRVAASEPFTVCLGQVPKFHAQAGVSGNRVAIKLLDTA